MALRHTQGFWPVALALCGNAFLTLIKFVAAAASGSSVMFSEAIHSVADTLNQTLLLIGLRRSLKKADREFEYGYGNERFFWALISACGIFFVGAGITAYKGLSALVQPAPIELGPVVLIVLALSLGIEAYTFDRADREIKRAFPDLPWRERIGKADPSTLAVYLEDAVAVAGVCVAAATISLSYLTKNSAWDAWGSLIIAALLASVAVILIVRNRSYLIGHSMPKELEVEIVGLLTRDPAVERVIDFKSAVVGLGVYRIKCEVEVNGSALLTRAFRSHSLRKHFDETRGFEEFKKYSVDFADRIPRLIGRKIDDLEAAIKKRFPSVRHIDIEIN